MTQVGSELIARERQRQIEVEQSPRQHDLQPSPDELINAALAYLVQGQDRLSAAIGHGVGSDGPECYWPFDLHSFNFDDDAVRSLTKAGALIAAAIDAARARQDSVSREPSGAHQ